MGFPPAISLISQASHQVWAASVKITNDHASGEIDVSSRCFSRKANNELFIVNGVSQRKENKGVELEASDRDRRREIRLRVKGIMRVAEAPDEGSRQLLDRS